MIPAKASRVTGPAPRSVPCSLEKVFPSDDEADEAGLHHLGVVIPCEASLRKVEERGGDESAPAEGSGAPTEAAEGEQETMGKGRRKRKAPEAMRQYEDPNNVDQLKTTTPYHKQQQQMGYGRGPGRPPKYGYDE